MPRLPPELGDHIISFLRCDPDTLQACSLVCKDWLPASRLYYPWTLSIDKDNAQTLTRLLSHPLSTFDKSYSMVEIWVDRSDPRKGNREVNVLDRLAVHLHKIKTRSLVLGGGDRHKPVRVRKRHEDVLSNWLAGITDLQLINFELHHSDNFYISCPLLTRLTFISLDRSPYAIGRAPPTIYPPHLHTIRISFEGFAILPDWLGLSRGYRPIDRLEIYSRTSSHLVVWDFLGFCPNLPAYNLYIALQMDSADLFSQCRQLDGSLSRSQFTELRSVHIHFCVEPSDLCPDLVLSRIRKLMPDLESRKIFELSLSFLDLKRSGPRNRDVHVLDRIKGLVNF